jgi:hypothetical protein
MDILVSAGRQGNRYSFGRVISRFFHITAE